MFAIPYIGEDYNPSISRMLNECPAVMQHVYVYQINAVDMT